MTFFDAIKTVFRKYAEFTGRASRPEFWWFTLFSVLVAAALNSLNVYTTSGSLLAMNATTSTITVGSSLAGLWSVVILLPSLAVTVRRLRDAGHDWKEIFWILLPIAGAIVLIVRLADPSVGLAPAAAPVVAAPPAKAPAKPKA